jgi:hypothetical protein
MGLKGYRLWATGQLDSNLQSPAAMRSDAKDSGLWRSPSAKVERCRLHLKCKL